MPISISSASLVFVFSDSGSSPTDYITNDPTLTLEIAVTAAQDTTDNSVLGIWLTGGAFSTGTLVGQITETVAGGPVYELFDLTTSSVPAATSLAEGDYNIIVTRGTTGVGTDVLAQHSLTVDTTPPGAPLISTVTDDVGPVTGNVADGGSTDDPTLTFDGTAEANATVTIADGQTTLGTTTADGTGAWTYTTAALSKGLHSFSVYAQDVAGNLSGGFAARSVTVDSTAVGVGPGISTVTDDVGAVTGNVANGATTDDNTLQLDGTADANATVTILFDRFMVLGTVTADGSGAWTYTTPALSNGFHVLSAYSMDNTGHSTALSERSVNVATSGNTSPGAPVISTVTDNVPQVTGDVPNGHTTNDSTLKLDGTTSAGASVTIQDGLTALGTVTANGSGAWTFTTPSLSEGLHNLFAYAVDSTGHLSAASDFRSVTVDVTAPSAPSAPDLLAGADSGVSNTDNITSITFPAFSGTADPLSTIRIYDTDGTTVLGTGFTGAAGQYSIGMSSALSEGVHTLTATAIDAAGNESAHSAGLTVTIDTTPPDLSNIVVAGDDILTSAEIQAGFTVTGTAPGIPDQTISVGLADFTTLQLLDTATATVTGGVWSVSVPAAAVARLSGDEFVVILEQIGGRAEAISSTAARI